MSWRIAVSGPMVNTPRRSVGMRYPALDLVALAQRGDGHAGRAGLTDRLDELEVR